MLCTARKTRHYLRRLNTLTCNEVESWFGLTDWLVGPRLSLTVSIRGPPATSNTCLDFLRTLCWAETKKEHYWLGPVYISIIFLLLCFQVCFPSILNALSLPLCLYEWNEKVCEIPYFSLKKGEKSPQKAPPAVFEPAASPESAALPANDANLRKKCKMCGCQLPPVKDILKQKKRKTKRDENFTHSKS